MCSGSSKVREVRMKQYLLGKLPAKIDKRTIRLSSILNWEVIKKQLPDLPSSYDVDEALGGIEDDFMFLNDTYGLCVKASRAHQTLRFEKYEQGKQIVITDDEVKNEYFRETGGADTGLYLLDSLKDWKNKGWMIGGKLYTIYAFASVNWRDYDEVKYCIHLLGGVNFGMLVYEQDIEQFDEGKPWELTGIDGSFLGGHGVYLFKYGVLTGYNKNGVTCMTWGKKQFMTWDFWDRRVDEAYGIVDNRNDWLEDSPVDVEKLDAYLDEITGNGEEPSGCLFSIIIIKILNWLWRIFGAKTRFPAPIVKPGGK